MRRIIRTELTKLAATRSTWLIVAASIAVAVVGVLQTTTAAETALPMARRQFFFLATVNLSVFMLALGAKSVTDEFRHSTIVTTLLVTPDRTRAAAAKLAAVAILGLAASAATVGAMVGTAASQLPSFGGTELRLVAGLVAGGALWAVVGGGVGLVVRHQLGAVVGVLVWAMVVEQMLRTKLGRAQIAVPGGAAGALALGPRATTIAIGGLILAGYVAALWVAGTLLLHRRDVG